MLFSSWLPLFMVPNGGANATREQGPGKPWFRGKLPRSIGTLWWFISSLLLPQFARNRDLGIVKKKKQSLCRLSVGNLLWFQTCISASLGRTMWKRVPEQAVMDASPFPPFPPKSSSPSTPAVKPTWPLLLNLPNPTLFPHRRADNLNQTSKQSITHGCLPACTPQETPFRPAD